MRVVPRANFPSSFKKIPSEMGFSFLFEMGESNVASWFLVGKSVALYKNCLTVWDLDNSYIPMVKKYYLSWLKEQVLILCTFSK